MKSKEVGYKMFFLQEVCVFWRELNSIRKGNEHSINTGKEGGTNDKES